MELIQPPTPLNAQSTSTGKSSSSSNYSVKSTPSGASIYVDGTEYGLTPGLIDIEAGLHRIELKLDGYKSWVDNRIIKSPDDRLDATLELIQPPTPLNMQSTSTGKSSSSSNYSVKSTPSGASIYVDGTEYGLTPGLIDIEAGLHRIELKLDGYKSWVDNKIIKSPDDRLDATLELIQPSTPPNTQPTSTGMSLSSSSYSVKSTPSGAAIYIDGTGYGLTPKIILVDSGRHHVELVHKSYKNWADDRYIQPTSDSLDVEMVEQPSSKEVLTLVFG